MAKAISEVLDEVEACIRHCDEKEKAYIISDLLSVAFSWGRTAERSVYWHTVYKALRRIAQHGVNSPTSDTPNISPQNEAISVSALFGPVDRSPENLARIHGLIHAAASAPGAYDEKPDYNPHD